MSRTIKLSPNALEILAHHTGRPIELDGENGRGYLDIADTTYWAEIPQW